MGTAASRTLPLALVAAVFLGPSVQPTRTAGSDTTHGRGEVVRLLTALPGGGFRPLAEDLVAVYRRSLPEVSFETTPGLSVEASLESIQQGGADLSFAYADQAYVAFVGRPRAGITPDARLRAIANLGVTPLQFVVRPGSRIRGIEDLRGARVGIGAPGSGTELTLALLVKAYGIRTSEIHFEHLAAVEAAHRLVAGTLDAMFIHTIYPASSLMAATSGGAQLVSLRGAPVDQLRRNYPFYKLARIPTGAYPHMRGDVETIGVDSLLICRRDLDEGLVYQLTKIFFDALPTLSSARTALRFMDADQAAAAPIPLHDGAARYYRERELMR